MQFWWIFSRNTFSGCQHLQVLSGTTEQCSFEQFLLDTCQTIFDGKSLHIYDVSNLLHRLTMSSASHWMLNFSKGGCQGGGMRSTEPF